MNIQHISGYKFIQLNQLPTLKIRLLEKCLELACKGTILISEEGININLSGETENIQVFKKFLQLDSLLRQVTFKESYSNFQAFKRLKIKLKKEIITMRCPDLHPELQAVPFLSPFQLEQWLTENRPLTLLDTRNAYEVRFGTFKNAVHLQLKDFSEFAKASRSLSLGSQPTILFCTGGIRCEKAGLQLIKTGHTDIYQLEGGILNYFAKTAGTHYQGDCFVFDDRVALDKQLRVTGTEQCKACYGPLPQVDKPMHRSCPTCIKYLT